MNRRSFVSNGLKAGVAFTILPRYVMGGAGFVAPSDRINLGFIGTGKQSYGLMNGLTDCKEVVVSAASDVDSKKLQNFISKTSDKLKSVDKPNSDLKGYRLYRELLERPDIDAVVIATPDHWHAQIAIDAAKAKKDIYCEKPLALTIAEGRAMVDAARKYKRVFQTGSMQRSSFNFRQAVELVRNGYVGTLKEVNVSIGDPVRQCDLPSLPVPAELDWDMWVGPSLYRGYHPTLAPELSNPMWADWRLYRDFGGGYISDWGAHMFDIVQWALDMDHSGPVLFIPPKYPLAKTGLSYVYKNGVRVNHANWGESNAIQFIGTEGKIEVSRSFIRTSNAPLAKMKFETKHERVYYSDNHYQDWVDAIMKRSKPICDVEIGQRTSTVCNAVNIAYELQTDLNWDPKKEQFDNVFANAMRSRPYRGMWDFSDF